MRLNVYSDELKGLGHKRRIEIVRETNKTNGKKYIGVRIHMNDGAVTFWSDGASSVANTLRSAAHDLENAFAAQPEPSLTELYNKYAQVAASGEAKHRAYCAEAEQTNEARAEETTSTKPGEAVKAAHQILHEAMVAHHQECENRRRAEEAIVLLDMLPDNATGAVNHGMFFGPVHKLAAAHLRRTLEDDK